jgi:hypothetical protein
VVFIKCDGYSGKNTIMTVISRPSLIYFVGPSTPGWSDIDPTWIPIIPVTARWEDKAGKSLSRTQLPLALAWAITIHKSQGLTLTAVVINLGPKDFSPGLSFVAISRVKTLKGLAFRTHFPWSCLQRGEETESMKMLKEDNIRRTNLGFTLETYGMDLTEFLFED